MSLVLSTFMKGFDKWAGSEHDISTTASIAWQTCIRVADGTEVSWITGLPGVPGEEMGVLELLIRQARSTIRIDLPDVDTSPPPGGLQLVGVPVWFWLDNHYPVSTTASIPTLSATLTATPGDVQIDLGDGETRFTCAGGGVRYDRERSHRDQQTDCAAPYLRHGTFPVTATVVWSLAWTASNGQSGTLPPVTRSTTFDLTVRQAQAVTD